jgi:hypothetical protein
MNSPALFTLAADIVLFLHVLVIIFNVFGLVLIFVGNALNWHWIRNPWFRLIHLFTICFVVLLSWLNFICPLTSIEMVLRTRAGDITYPGSFISHWLESILYYQAPPWVFVVSYTIFGAVVVMSWFLVRPRRFSNF